MKLFLLSPPYRLCSYPHTCFIMFQIIFTSQIRLFLNWDKWRLCITDSRECQNDFFSFSQYSLFFFLFVQLAMSFTGEFLKWLKITVPLVVCRTTDLSLLSWQPDTQFNCLAMTLGSRRSVQNAQYRWFSSATSTSSLLSTTVVISIVSLLFIATSPAYACGRPLVYVSVTRCNPWVCA